jgi:hypothetical protein
MAHQNEATDEFRECTLGYRWELSGKSLQWQMYRRKSILVYLYSALNCWHSTAKLKWHALYTRYEYSSVTFSCVSRYRLKCTFFLLWSNPHLLPIVKKLILCLRKARRFQDMHLLENSSCGRRDAVQNWNCCSYKVTIILIVVLPCILINIKLSFQQMHYLWKHKMLQFVFKYFFTQLLHVSVPLDHHQGAHIRALLKLQSL